MKFGITGNVFKKVLQRSSSKACLDFNSEVLRARARNSQEQTDRKKGRHYFLEIKRKSTSKSKFTFHTGKSKMSKTDSTPAIKI